MKYLGLLFTVFCIFNACREDAYICKNPKLIEPYAVCDSSYEPVCGCDGITYTNSCVAELKAGLLEWTKGPCESICNYTDTVLVFSADPTCILLQNSTSELYEVVTSSTSIIWELGEYYLIQHLECDTTTICMIGNPINIICADKFDIDTNCKMVIPTDDDDNLLPNDTLQINGLNLFNDCLEINYDYLGGCNPDRVDLYHLTDSSDENYTRLQIRYDNGGGPCTDPYTKSDYFDLSSLQIENQNSITIKIDCNGDEDFFEEFNYEY